MPNPQVDIARHRLEVLFADTDTKREGPRTIPGRWLEHQEREALRVVHDELHRLNIAVSQQARIIKNVANAKKQIARKLLRERSQAAATRRTKRKP